MWIKMDPLDEDEDVVAAETFEELCVFCEKGKAECVSETMLSNPRAETVWVNQRREFDMATPLIIATFWGHSHLVALLLGSGANPMLRVRSCKKDWCRHQFPIKPGSSCPGFMNPEHPDDPGETALQVAKNRAHAQIVLLVKHHVFNCVAHEECRAYRTGHPDDLVGMKRELPRDDPVLLSRAPDPGAALDGTSKPLWPLKHFGRAFRAASEGDTGLVKRVVREWRAAAAAEDDDADPDEVRDGGDPVRPDPCKARHPATGETLLHAAARQRDPDMVAFLVKAGCDPQVNDKWTTSPLWYACDHGRFQNAVLLAEACDIKELRRPQGRGGTSPPQAAVANRHAALAAFLHAEVTRRLGNGAR